MTERQTADPYAHIASLYDLEHADFEDDLDLLLNFAEVVGDPILELGCGSGRVMTRLAHAGFRVTGIDTSEPMLARGRETAQREGVADLLTFCNLDMTAADAAPGGPFGLAIVSLNGMMHLSSSAQQRAMLRGVREALDPRGQIVIDTMNPSLDQLQLLYRGPHREGSWTLDDGAVIDKWSHRQPGAEAQVIDTLLWYDQTATDGSLTRVRSAFSLRYVTAAEILLMLELEGFVEPMVYGSYDLDPWDPEAERLIVTAEVTPSPGKVS